METTTKRSIKMSFNVNGENMTRLIRTCWSEGRIQPAINIIESCGCPEQFWLDVFTGNAKMEGNSNEDTLHIEPDTESFHDGVDITFDGMNNRMVAELKKHSILYANADSRMKYWPLRMDGMGVSYKTGKLGDYEELNGNTFAKDKTVVQKSGLILTELKPFFQYIYPMKDKSMFDIDWSDVADKIETFDYWHPNYLPIMSDRAKNGKDMPVADLKEELTGRALGKYTDILGEPSTVLAQQFTKEQEIESKKRLQSVISPFGLDIPEVTNAWIDRNGNFYGDYRSSIMFTLIHLEMADKIYDAGLIPAELNVDCKNDPAKFIESTGWIKLSANQFFYYPKNLKLQITKQQLKTIKEYAKHRNMNSVNLGYFDKNYPIEKLTIESFNL
ncbi:MAG: hypothetical protein WC979_02320 [Candidatus Pacearchaeota archaeon]|jgi:hypothetical protein|nr:hypothetical protein [Clostridia bacterium]